MLYINHKNTRKAERHNLWSQIEHEQHHPNRRKKKQDQISTESETTPPKYAVAHD